MWKKRSLIEKEMIAGIAAYGIVVQLVLLFISESRLHSSVGLWIGLLIAAAMVVHMHYSIDNALQLDEKGAIGFMRKTSVLRIGLIMLILVLISYFQIGNIWITVVGIFGLKVAAYLQPFTNKYFSKKFLDKGR